MGETSDVGAAAVEYVAYLLEGHDYGDVVSFLTRHVAWRRRQMILSRAMELVDLGPVVTKALPRWVEAEAIEGVLALDWRWVTSADPRWTPDVDEAYRRRWAETVVIGHARRCSTGALALVEQTAIYDGTVTRVLNPALPALLRIEYFDEIRAQLALRDRMQRRMPAAG
jgi:hypothetical protein